MRVAHLSTKDIHGGAAKAAFRIHSALNLSIDSFMLVNNKDSDVESIIGPQSAQEKLFIKLKTKFSYEPARFLTKNSRLMFSNGFFSSKRMLKRLNEINPEVVNLHWINESLISLTEIEKLKKPIVWTVHDMWPFTGGCHYTNMCENYKIKCNRCPELKSKGSYDLSTFIFNYKKSKLKREITFVAPSKWMQNCIQDSALFGQNKVYNIPYPIDLDIFKPREKSFLRKLFGLPEEKKLILFGAENATQDARKGFKYLQEALGLISQYNKNMNIEFVVFGATQSANETKLPFKINYLGKYVDEISLAAIYGACDIFVAPSIQDNLPNTVMESLACGVPVVAFSIGGMPDMIDHNINGYLSTPLSSESLAQGIIQMIEGDSESLSAKSRLKAIEMFSPERVSEKYLTLYKSLIQ